MNQNIKVLCMPLKTAARQGLIDSYPYEGIRKVKENKVKIEPLSFEELDHWLNFLQEKDREWYDLILFWSRTGLRPGELFALRWENVDFFNKQILICENRPYFGGTGPTKTETSDRVIELRPAVVVALKRQQTRTGLINKWVFLNHRQNQWNATSFREAFKFHLRLASLKVRPAKQMRHTFATLHLGSGENPSWVSTTLGHSNLEITLKRYNRFIPNLTREDGSAFEKALNGHN
ncbi:MAG: site-specific integrase [Deltaproteobacteria bacterium]|nr:site-specific integrase [Deltaproteobacteria bacterium]